ncbi:hypothetical protein SCOCK_300114 [Actinacidiphila cocklensis]|uniref:Uncharacterized protein n=1 Tax=Actinacidiphila cocklensis TaxID=887465 RepID=A0A9W4DPL2_9ACTN|nr:hypothetical protein SCOCK_300114 [Actinacidiphila cocklensis]
MIYRHPQGRTPLPRAPDMSLGHQGPGEENAYVRLPCRAGESADALTSACGSPTVIPAHI